MIKLCLALTGLLWAHQAMALDSSEPGGAGSLRFNGGDGEAVLLGADVDIQVTGMVARVTLRQRYQNTSARYQEATYRFPLPDAAAVDRMVMELGQRRIVGNVQEKQQAQRTYEAAKQAGKRAALTRQERPNLFTQAVSNIGPQQTVTIELSYVQSLRYDQGAFTLTYPMTFTPRYVPGQHADPVVAPEQPLLTTAWGENASAPVDAARASRDPQALASRFIPAHHAPKARISVTIDAGLPLAEVESLYHPLHVERQGPTYRMASEEEGLAMSRDLRLRWRPQLSAQPRAAFFTEQKSEADAGAEHYGLLMVMPPQADAAFARPPRELIFVIDTSGSMGGASIRQAKQALAYGLSRLTAQDRFNLIQFNSTPDALFEQPVATDQFHRRLAQRYVQRLKADGGTEMASAIRLALGQPAEEGYIRQVIFITDGSVANEAGLFHLIETNLRGARFFTVGIGAAPNSYFMRKAAEFGRGTYTYIGDLNQVGERMQHLFSKLEKPLLTELSLAWPDGAKVEQFPHPLLDLYAGEPVLAAVKFSGELPNRVNLSGRLAGQPWHMPVQLTSAIAQSGIGSLWARRKIEQLLHRRGDAEQARSDVIALALEHQIVSRYTSFVAVEEVVSNPLGAPEQSHRVPSALPAGSTQQVGFPQGATAKQAYGLQGLIALALYGWLGWAYRTRGQQA